MILNEANLNGAKVTDTNFNKADLAETVMPVEE
jgi:uncharacterized protein YjbI with pentapeptide repeats